MFSFSLREGWCGVLFSLTVDRTSMGPQTYHLCIRQSHLPSNETNYSDRGIIFTLNSNYCAIFCSHFGIPTSQHRPIHSCLLDLSMHIHESQQLGDIWRNCSASNNYSKLYYMETNYVNLDFRRSWLFSWGRGSEALECVSLLGQHVLLSYDGTGLPHS